MFQEGTSGRSLENFQKGLFDMLIVIIKHIDDISLKLDDTWHLEVSRISIIYQFLS